MREAQKIAKADGVSVNRLFTMAVGEKLSALRTDEYFAERAARGDIKKALQVLKRAGNTHGRHCVGNPKIEIIRLADVKRIVCATQHVDVPPPTRMRIVVSSG